MAETIARTAIEAQATCVVGTQKCETMPVINGQTSLRKGDRFQKNSEVERIQENRKPVCGGNDEKT